MSTDVFAVVSDPTRRRILRAVRDGERPVNDIVAELGVSQPTVSKHLRVLREAGLVRMHARGQRRLYVLEAGPLEELVAWVRGLSAEPAADRSQDSDPAEATGPGVDSTGSGPVDAGSRNDRPEASDPAAVSPAAPAEDAERTEPSGSEAADVDVPHAADPDAAVPAVDAPEADSPRESASRPAAEAVPARPEPVRRRPRRAADVVFRPLVIPDGPEPEEPEAPAPEDVPLPSHEPARAHEPASAEEPVRPAEPEPESDAAGPEPAEESAPASAPETLDPLAHRPRGEETAEGSEHRQSRFLASLFSRRRGRP